MMRATLLLLPFAAAGCGMDFKIADQGKNRDDPNPKATTVDAKPLVTTSDADPRADNEVFDTEVSKLEASFDYHADVTTEVSVWVTKFKPKKCGDLESVKAEFRWAGVEADGAVGPGTAVAIQDWHRVEAGATQRLSVKMETSFGYCEQMLLRFEAHTRVL